MKLSPVFSPEAHQAYRALLDCKVIRTQFDHPGFIELFEANIADCTPAPCDGDEALDWVLIQ
ncbi:hypothetical protein [Novosphingobium aquae]|uniref:Uncharacterized protein n=1 Tax=Novosphingobium aquae TaxID=3133435 RepID=A0ABU8S3X0_9SPHN